MNEGSLASNGPLSGAIQVFAKLYVEGMLAIRRAYCRDEIRGKLLFGDDRIFENRNAVVANLGLSKPVGPERYK